MILNLVKIYYGRSKLLYHLVLYTYVEISNIRAFARIFIKLLER